MPAQLNRATPLTAHPPAYPEAPALCYLDILHILVAHIAWEGKDTVLAKARGATIVH